MKYDSKLIDIVRDRKFKTIWHCMNYLQLAEYSIFDSFDLSMKEYGGEKIFSRIAFVRGEVTNIIHPYNLFPINTYTITVGLIDDTNIHLHGMYKIYRKWLGDGKSTNSNSETNIIDVELENSCEKIVIKNITPLILDFLNNESLGQFGHKIYIEKQHSVNHNPPTLVDLTEEDIRPTTDELIRKIRIMHEEQIRRDRENGRNGY